MLRIDILQEATNTQARIPAAWENIFYRLSPGHRQRPSESLKWLKKRDFALRAAGR